MSIEYEDALDQYFELKTAYDTKLNKLKSRIINDDGLSTKRKRKHISKIKMKCISCKRNVGTIFELRNNNYTALCGDQSSPCKLNILLERGVTINIEDELNNTEKRIQKLKEAMIDLKLELVYGIQTEEDVEDEFREIVDFIDDATKSIDVYKQMYEINTDEKERNSNKKNIQRELFDLLDTIQENMKEYQSTKNIKYIQEIIEIYGDQVSPLVQSLRENKYRTQFIEMNPQTNKFHLTQKENAIEDLELIYKEGEVHSFIL